MLAWPIFRMRNWAGLGRASQPSPWPAPLLLISRDLAPEQVSVLSAIRSASEGRAEPLPRVAQRYARAIASPGALDLQELQAPRRDCASIASPSPLHLLLHPPLPLPLPLPLSPMSAASPPRLQSLQHEALAQLLGLDYDLVASRHAAIARAFGEWPSPELLFRYLDDNRDDEEMAPLVRRRAARISAPAPAPTLTLDRAAAAASTRWLLPPPRWVRALFGLSDETPRQMRREAESNVRHLSLVPPEALLRWYSDACPGTSDAKVMPRQGFLGRGEAHPQTGPVIPAP